jgi:hypothetical protein
MRQLLASSIMTRTTLDIDDREALGRLLDKDNLDKLEP